MGRSSERITSSVLLDKSVDISIHYRIPVNSSEELSVPMDG
jgi:hypothetical protein